MIIFHALKKSMLAFSGKCLGLPFVGIFYNHNLSFFHADTETSQHLPAEFTEKLHALI